MRSKATLAGHPLHPILIPFPIVFFLGGFLCSLVSTMSEDSFWALASSWMIAGGIVTAVVAAVPGLVDLLLIVPPNSSGKAKGIRHMMSNVVALILFIIAWLIDDSAAAPPSTAELALQAVGVLLVAVGGWLGGSLVYKNLIGVEHRYAAGGNWSERVIDAKPGETVEVAAMDELKVDQMMLLRVNGQRLVLCRHADGYSIHDDRCTHKGGSLADGVAMCGKVHCLWHGSQFDQKTGEVKGGPAQTPISTYAVDQQDNKIRLKLHPDIDCARDN